MNRREIVQAALEHRETDPIPYHLDLGQVSLEKLIAATGDPDIEGKLGVYIHGVQYWGWPTELPDRPGYFRDEFGVIWNRSGVDKDIGVLDNIQIEDLECNGYALPVADTARLRGDIENLLGTRQDKFAMMGFGFCMFERSWSLMGMENVLMSMLTCPDELEMLYDRICDFYLELVDIALEYEVDGVYFGDDWGQQSGLIMGAGHWRRFIKPRMARLYARVKEKGRYVIQHSCGDCHEIFPDLIEIGLDCYQTFQPEIYDIAQMKRLYGDRLSFWGGISTQRVLPFETPDGVKAEIARIVNTLRKGGGLIIAPTHALPCDVPAENILAMLEVFQNQGRYF